VVESNAIGDGSGGSRKDGVGLKGRRREIGWEEVGWRRDTESPELSDR
jgi:hypothetical protein